jgi:TonB family protein
MKTSTWSNLIGGGLMLVVFGGIALQWRANREQARTIGTMQGETSRLEVLREENGRLERGAKEWAAESANYGTEAAESARLREKATALVEHLKASAQKGPAGNLPGSSSAAATGNAVMYDLEDLDQKPAVVSQGARPVYPFALRRAGIGGQAVISFVVGADGEIHDVQGIRATHPGFEQAAVDAVKKWKFTSGQKAGLPVNTRMRIPVVFSLGAAETAGAAWF